MFISKNNSIIYFNKQHKLYFYHTRDKGIFTNELLGKCAKISFISRNDIIDFVVVFETDIFSIKTNQQIRSNHLKTTANAIIDYFKNRKKMRDIVFGNEGEWDVNFEYTFYMYKNDLDPNHFRMQSRPVQPFFDAKNINSSLYYSFYLNDNTVERVSFNGA